MDEHPLERRFRLLLSWQEKARRLAGSNATGEGDGKFSKRRLAAESAAADRALDAARNAGTTDLDRLAAQLRGHLDNLSSAATVKLPKAGTGQANETTPEIESVREEIARYNKVLSARSPDDLGGFLDLPLSGYRVALGLGDSRRSSVGKLESTPRNMLIAAVAAAVIGIAGALLYHQGRQEVVFEIGGLEGGDTVTVRCANHTNSPIAFWIPAGETFDGAESYPAYGVEVYGKAPDDDRFRQLPIPPEAWSMAGALAMPELPLVIQPGLDLRIQLHFGPYSQLIGPVETFRVTAKDHRGRTRAVQTFTPTS